MKKVYYSAATLISMIAIIAFSAGESLTSSVAAPFGNTGSIGDGSGQTCGKLGCHATATNTGPGSLTIDLSDIPSTGWRAGNTYSITVNLSESGKGTFGFQLTAEDPSGNKKGSFTGNNQVVVANTSWPTHKNTSSTGNWTFDWTAPNDNSQQIIFYAAGNAANGNGQPTGDNIYTVSSSSNKDPLSGLDNANSKASFKVMTNPVRQTLRLRAPVGSTLFIYSLNGQMKKTFVQYADITEVAVDDLNSGMYLLVNEDRTFTERILLK
ncbi:MAG: choice-of-anchor V domain-containing protein [Vicingaceae bacterium]